MSSYFSAGHCKSKIVLAVKVFGYYSCILPLLIQRMQWLFTGGYTEIHSSVTQVQALTE